jgi:hypothetical protein
VDMASASGTEHPGSNPARVKSFDVENIAMLLCVIDLVCIVCVFKWEMEAQIYVLIMKWNLSQCGSNASWNRARCSPTPGVDLINRFRPKFIDKTYFWPDLSF